MTQFPNDGQIARFDYEGSQFRFFVNNRNDHIQHYHHTGRFYEEEELAIIRRHMKAGDVVLDVGANIGNHSVFFDRICKAARVLPFEVYPSTVEHYIVNTSLNDCRSVDTRYIGYGLGDRFGVFGMREVRNNPGANALVKGGTADRQFLCLRGDDLIDEPRVDFIKMDIEGNELAALKGMERLLTTNRPVLFIEVWNKQIETLIELLNSRYGYIPRDSFARYKHCTNIVFC
jgi:FkbM family methyltransferase